MVDVLKLTTLISSWRRTLCVTIFKNDWSYMPHQEVRFERNAQLHIVFKLSNNGTGQNIYSSTLQYF